MTFSFKDFQNTNGYVAYISHMGSDQAICDAARVSTGSEAKGLGLIRYLMRHGHSSPFEFGQLVLEIKCPIFLARQIMRHRTFSYAETSLRYQEGEEEHWTVWHPRLADPSKKQGASEATVFNTELIDSDDTAEEHAFKQYNQRLQDGWCREQARSCLPVSMYTKFRMTGNVRNWLHFANLRSRYEAQPEVQEISRCVEQVLAELFPVTYIAWVDHVRDVISLSKQEQDLITAYVLKDGTLKDQFDRLSKGERQEFLHKFEGLFKQLPDELPLVTE